MQDNYGNEVNTDNLVLLPDIMLLGDSEIKVMVNAKWYDVIFENGQTFLCADYFEIDGMAEDSIVGCIEPKGGINEIMLINEVLKRWSEEDGFYHA